MKAAEKFSSGFDSGPLAELAGHALAIRSACKSLLKNFICERVREQGEEKLELRYELQGEQPVQLALDLWADRRVRVSLSQYTRNKVERSYQWQMQGSSGDRTIEELAQAIKSSLVLEFGDNAAGAEDELTALWRASLD